jgi:4-hydroxy-tetrahydrodipicolinate synthase
VARPPRELDLKGVIPAAITPRLTKVPEPDYSGALDLLDFLANGGATAVLLLGSTGEFLDYSFAERQRLVYLAVKRSRVPLIAGVSHSTFEGAVQLAEEAIAAGVDGLLLMPPYFFRYGQSEIEEFYLEFARATREAVPLLLYNIPQLTNPLEIDTVSRLLATGRFAGLKDSSGDWDYFSRLIALKRQHSFALFNGGDRLAPQALREGADGLISGAASAVPELMAAIYRSPGSQRLEDKLNEFLDRLDCFPFPAGIKRAVAARGQKAGPMLTPLAPATHAHLEEFAAWFSAWIPEMLKTVQEAAANA